jgi:parallel beta-helix repeat protein
VQFNVSAETPAPAQILIQANGDVSPASAPIQRVGSHYTLTANLDGYCLVMECSNVVFEGAGFASVGQANKGEGISLQGVTNVTVQGLTVEGFDSGIDLEYCSNCVLQNNNLVDNGVGIYLTDSSNNTIQQNGIKNSGTGIIISSCTETNIVDNTVTENSYDGVALSYNSDQTVLYRNVIAKNNIGINIINSSQNLILGNNITQNSAFGIKLQQAQTDNSIYNNNFIDNSPLFGFAVSMPWPVNPAEWDNGVVGNYWSDYHSRYPNATEVSGTGVGDTAYLINENNIDHHPLMQPVTDPQLPHSDLNPSRPSTDVPNPILVAVAAVAVAFAASAVAALVWFRKHK